MITKILNGRQNWQHCKYRLSGRRILSQGHNPEINSLTILYRTKENIKLQPALTYVSIFEDVYEFKKGIQACLHGLLK